MVKIRRQGLSCRGRHLAQIGEATGGGRNWAKVGVTAAAEANSLATHAIFLSGELEGNKCGGGKVLGGGGEGV